MWARVLPVLLYLVVTVPLAFILNVWQDDAYTLHTTSAGAPYAFSQAITFETNAPLYFVALALWRHIDESAIWARAFSVICGGAAVACVPALVRRYVPQSTQPAVTLAIALNPLLIWAALEIRVYALVILISALLLLFFYDGFLDDRSNRRAQVLYGIACIVGAYTQYYILFLVAAQGIVLFLRRRNVKAYITTQIAVAIAFVPMLAIAYAQMSDFRGGLTPPTLAQSLRFPLQIVVVYVLPLNALPENHAILYGAAALGIVCAILVCIRYYRRDGCGLLVEMMAAAYLFFALGLYAAREPVFTRHMAVLFLPAALAVFSLFTFLQQPVRRRASICYAAIAVVVNIAALTATYRHLAKPGDWMRVASFISAREISNEPIVVFEAENALPLAYYYHGKNRIVPLPRGIDFRLFDQRRFVVRSAHEIAARMQSAHANGKVWFVTAGDCSSENIQFGCGVVENYVATHYRILNARRFYKATVRLLQPAFAAHARQATVRTDAHQVNVL